MSLNISLAYILCLNAPLNGEVLYGPEIVSNFWVYYELTMIILKKRTNYLPLFY